MIHFGNMSSLVHASRSVGEATTRSMVLASTPTHTSLAFLGTCSRVGAVSRHTEEREGIPEVKETVGGSVWSEGLGSGAADVERSEPCGGTSGATMLELLGEEATALLLHVP